jgi:hypothetical protein
MLRGRTGRLVEVDSAAAALIPATSKAARARPLRSGVTAIIVPAQGLAFAGEQYGTFRRVGGSCGVDAAGAPSSVCRGRPWIYSAEGSPRAALAVTSGVLATAIGEPDSPADRWPPARRCQPGRLIGPHGRAASAICIASLTADQIGGPSRAVAGPHLAAFTLVPARAHADLIREGPSPRRDRAQPGIRGDSMRAKLCRRSRPRGTPRLSRELTRPRCQPGSRSDGQLAQDVNHAPG